MTTSHATLSAGPKFVDRLVGGLIDRNGDTYGDEMERTRYYEVHSALIQLQLIATYIAGTIGLFLVSGRAADVLFWVVLGPQMMSLIGLPYLTNRGVRIKELTRRSRKRPIFWIYMATYLAFIGTYLIRKYLEMNDGTSAWGFAAGMVFGGLAIGATIAVIKKSRRTNSATDLDNR